MNNLGMGARPDMFRGGMCPDFKPPSETQPPAPTNPKKRRKTANNNSAPIQPTPPTPADLLPPPLTGYGEKTIVVSNPFDDAPQSSSSMGHFGMNPHLHQINPHVMGHPPAMRGMNPMMNTIPGMPGHHLNNRGLSPMNNINSNLSPMGLGSMNQISNHAMNQIGSMQPNSPNSLNTGPLMRPPMHSPLANGPGNPNGRINGSQMSSSQHSPHPQMGNLNSPNNTGPVQNNVNNVPNSMPVSSAATSQMNMMTQVNTGSNQGGLYGGPKPMPVSAGKVLLHHLSLQSVHTLCTIHLFLFIRFTRQIVLWFLIRRIRMHPLYIRVEFAIKKFMIMTKDFCASLDAIFGFIGRFSCMMEIYLFK